MAHVCAPQLSELEPNLPVGFPDDPRGRVVDLIERDRPTSPAGSGRGGWMDGRIFSDLTSPSACSFWLTESTLNYVLREKHR